MFALLMVIATLAPGATASRLPDNRALSRLNRGVELATRFIRARPEDVYLAQSAIMRGVALGGCNTLAARDALELVASIGVAPAYEATTTSERAARKRCTALNLLDSGAGIDCLNSRRYMIPGTERVNTTAIATANVV